MKSSFTIFYSWQSDLKRNRNFIQNCVEKAIKEVVRKQNKDVKLEINVDRDTRNKSGSPAISNTIFRKIENCDILICDVSIVNKTFISRLFKSRVTPNPNVLIELGYGVHVLGWERVICVSNSSIASLEELPFDIRGHRVTSFSDVTTKEEFIKVMMVAIETIINNYDSILEEQSKSRNTVHDVNIYKKIDRICNETNLDESISLPVNSLFTNKYYLGIWDDLQAFYNQVVNNFIDKELDDLFRQFLKALNDFDTILTVSFHAEDRETPEYKKYLFMKVNNEPLTDDQEFEFKQLQIFAPYKAPFRNETWEDSDRRIYKLQDDLFEKGEEIKSSYRNFIMKVKTKLL